MLTKKQINHAQNILRRASYRAPGCIKAMNAAKKYVKVHNKDGSVSKKKHVRYQCAHCNNWFSRKQVQRDHIDPVIDPAEGFVNLEKYYVRLFVDEDRWQILCKDCHNKKTRSENKIRQKRGRK